MNKIKIYTAVKNITPPVIFNNLSKSSIYPKIKKVISGVFKNTYQPSWQTVQNGPLKGREIFVSKSESWVPMINGDYDNFFLEYLRTLDLKGKTIFDIGTHIGFNALIFAELVGEQGKVVCFEPNIFNKERFETILTKNTDLAKHIVIHPVAISNADGDTEFVFTDNIEGGTSSGSFINEADTHFEKGHYEAANGFKRMKVQTVRFDSLTKNGVNEKPYLMKIDIEGAEWLALDGGRQFIAEHGPILLIEIHSIFNMMKVGDILQSLSYNIKLLKEESDGRCFIACTPNE